MEEIIISETTPRDKALFDTIRVSKGIEKYYLLAVGLLFLGLMSIGAIFLPPYEIGLTLFQAIAGGTLIIAGLFMVLINNQKVKSRKAALLTGKIVEGTVIDHSRKLNPTSSKRYYAIRIKYQENNTDDIVTINTSDKKLLEELPLQSKTLGILTNLPKYKVFFPAEVGVNLIIKE